MNKIFCMFCMALATISFSACSNDDTENPYAQETTINITRADLDFAASASEGAIVFEAQGTVTATSASEWCSVAVVGDSVKVSVKQNVSVNGRSTVVKLVCGNGSVSLAVTQLGVVFQLDKSSIIASNDNVQTKVVGLTSNVDVVIESAPEWVTVNLVNNDVVVDFTENTTGHLRKGYVKFRSEEFVDSVLIAQADFNKDIAGKYTLYYTDEKRRSRNTTVTLTEDEIQIRSPKLDVPITYDPETMTIKLQCGSYCGKLSSYYIYARFTTHMDDNGGVRYTLYETNLSIGGLVDYGPLVMNEGQVGNSFSLGGYFYESTMVGGLLFWKFTKQELSESADAGSFLVAMFDPYLERVIE